MYKLTGYQNLLTEFCRYGCKISIGQGDKNCDHLPSCLISYENYIAPHTFRIKNDKHGWIEFTRNK